MTSLAIGDKVIYPGLGPAQVQGIEDKEIAGTKQTFHVLALLDGERKILVPLGKLSSLRALATEEEIGEVLAALQDGETPQKDVWIRRVRAYKEKMATGTIHDLAEVLRDLVRIRDSRGLPYSEKRLLDEVQGLVVGEVSAALGCRQGRAERMIAEALERREQQGEPARGCA